MSDIFCHIETPWGVASRLECGETLDVSSESISVLRDWLFELHRCRQALAEINKEIIIAKAEKPII